MFVTAAAVWSMGAEAAPITAAAGFQNTAGTPVQTVQWRNWDSGTQYGSDYEYYGPRYGTAAPATRNLGEPSPTGTQYGSDYNYYGPRYGSTAPRTWNPGEPSPMGTQYGSDYQYYGPTYGAGYSPNVYQAYSYSGGSQASCQQRFRTFDPASGTYMGRDGRRHPCP